MVLSESCKSLFQVGYVVLRRLAFYKHVVHVHFHVLANLLLEDLFDEALVSRHCIFLAKGHYLVAVEASASEKGCFLLVFGCLLDLVVPRDCIYGGW